MTQVAGVSFGSVYNPYVTAFNVLDYGADPTGTNDSTSAIQAAINAAQNGGIVYFPTIAGGAVYLISSTLTIGNGSNNAVSTWGPVILQGVGPGNDSNGAGINVVTLRWKTGTAGSIMVQIVGPQNGWGINDMELDGNNIVGTTGLQMNAAQFGRSYGLTIKRCTTHWYSVTQPAGGSLSGSALDSIHNHFRDLTIIFGTIAGAQTGIQFDTSAANTGNTTYDVLDNVYVVFSTGGGQQFGLTFGGCDTNTVRNLHFAGINSAPASSRLLRYQYNNVAQASWPTATKIDKVDFGTSSSGFIINTGAPSGANLNSVSDINSGNGTPPNPNLANLVWGGITDEAAGTATISAATSVSVAHGLGATPTRVLVTPGTTGSGAPYVTAIGATNFTINVPTSGTYTMYWMAKL